MSLTAGYPSLIGTGDNAPGVKNFYIGVISDQVITDGAGGDIGMLAGTGILYRFKCASTEGDWTEAGSYGAGGQEQIQTANYRLEGLSQSKRNLIENLMECPEVIIIAEGRKGDSVDKFWLLGEHNGMNPTTSNTGSGIGGGGPTAIGNTVVWTGNQPKKARAFELTAAEGLMDALTTITISAT